MQKPVHTERYVLSISILWIFLLFLMMTCYVVLQTQPQKNRSGKWIIEDMGYISEVLLSNKPPQLAAAYDNKHLFSYPEFWGSSAMVLLWLHICKLAAGLD